jgi:hypothetical protein
VRRAGPPIPEDSNQTSFRLLASGIGLILSHAVFSLPISLAKKKKAVKKFIFLTAFENHLIYEIKVLGNS